jgi:hypothetical protein
MMTAILRLVAVLAFSTPSVAQITLEDDCRGHLATFDFFADSSVQTHPMNLQQAFVEVFCAQVPKVESWARTQKWPILAGLPRMKILVAEHFGLGRSLVPAWEGDRGRVEFPARRVIPQSDGQIRADVAHEIVHVYFPNGNRMLAEGIAVYVQDETMTNPAYPNFGRPVHERVFCELYQRQVLQTVSLAKLDDISTPLPPIIDLPANFPLDEGLAAYLVSGSFVRYLIDAYTMEKFRELYEKTPFQVGRHIRRDKTRDDWMDVYGRSLGLLEGEWKTMISKLTVNCSSLSPMSKEDHKASAG